MKREFLKGLGIEDATTIDKILDEYHREAGTSANLQKEKETLETQVKTLQETIKKFDGVDVDKLRAEIDNVKAEYQAKREADLKQNAISQALAGAKYPELLASKIDVSKLKVESDKVTGIEEQVTALKTSYADFFNDQGVQGFKPNAGATPPQAMTKEEIMKIADRAEREKAIEANLNLFIEE